MAIDPGKISKEPEKLKVTQTSTGRKVVLKDLKEDDDGDEQAKDSGSKSKKVVLILVGSAIVAVLFVLVFYMFTSKEDSNKVDSTADVSSGVADNATTDDVQQPEDPAKIGAEKPWLNGGSDSSTSGDAQQSQSDQPTKTEGFVNGMKDIAGDTVHQNTSKLEPEKFTKDLDGNSIKEDYNIEKIYNTVDFVSYTKHRARTAEGVELYWLDAKYKGRAAKIQVSFSVFKEMDPVGVVPVTVEVVVVDEGDGVTHEVATDFVVQPNYKEILEDGIK